jgi:hypothetical protein
MKRYVCLLCSTHFPTAFLLERHQREHKKELKKYECRICNWTAPTNFALELHMNKNHKSALDHRYKYKCLLCNFSAKSAYLKKKHVDESHKKPVQPPSLIDAYEILKTIAAITLIFY